jgi:hypothetical protein
MCTHRGLRAVLLGVATLFIAVSHAVSATAGRILPLQGCVEQQVEQQEYAAHTQYVDEQKPITLGSSIHHSHCTSWSYVCTIIHIVNRMHNNYARTSAHARIKLLSRLHLVSSPRAVLQHRQAIGTHNRRDYLLLTRLEMHLRMPVV